MDLTGVIVELRSELESIDEAIASLGKLADLRKRRNRGDDEAELAGSPTVKRASRGRKVHAGGSADEYEA
jgi:hypothetical protein